MTTSRLWWWLSGQLNTFQLDEPSSYLVANRKKHGHSEAFFTF